MPEQKETSSYLKQLRFDPKLMQSFAAKYVLNVRLMFLFVISIVVWGIFGYVNLPRRTMPEVEIPYVFVTTVLPGAPPEDVEQLVTIPLEDAISGIDKIDTYSSSSSESVSMVVVQFESSVGPKDARSEVQSAVDSVNLPSDAVDPNVMDLDFENTPVWTFAVTTQGDMATLIRFAEELQDRVEEEGEINKVVVTGIEDQEIQVLIKPEVMNELQLSPMSLQQAIAAETTSYPGGTLSSGTSNYGVGLDPVIESVEDLRQKLITIDGKTYVLGEIAIVMERSAPNQGKTFFAYGKEENSKSEIRNPKRYQNSNIEIQNEDERSFQRAVSFSVYKRTGEDLDKAAQVAKAAAEEVIDKYEGRFKLVTIMDYDQMIQEQFDDLFNDFFTSIGLVFGTLLLFLGIRQASIASMVIPISFLFTFGAVEAMGLSLNFLTLFSLLLAQGMIVDDVIVIISAMTDYYKTGKFTPTQAGLLVWRDYIQPTLTSNLTNVWSFAPLLITTGIIGEFIKSIPLVVMAALIGSTAISLLVTIPLMVIILKPEVPKRVQWLLRILGLLVLVGVGVRFLAGNQLAVLAVVAVVVFAVVARVTWGKVKYQVSSIRYQGKRFKWMDNIGTYIQEGVFSVKGLVQVYKRVLTAVLKTKGGRRKAMVAVVMFSVFSYALVPLGYVKNEFFPKTDQENLYVTLELPVGTSLERTTTEGLRLLEELKRTPEIEYVTAEIGAGADMSFIGASGGMETNKVRFSLKLPPKEGRGLSSMEISSGLRDKYAGYDKGQLLVVEETGGPPTGADMQITLLGQNLSVLETKAAEVKQFLDDLDGVVDADVSVEPGVGKVRFVPDTTAMADAGMSVGQVGMALRAYISGMQLDEVRFGEEDKKEIVLRMNEGLLSPEDLGSLEIADRNGVGIPLLSLGRLELVASPTQITREDGDRSITVTAAVEPGYQVPERGKKLEEFADGELDLPQGYSWKLGGANQENQESVKSIVQAMGIAALLIAGTMVVQLQSFRKAAVVMLVIPLAISGVYVLFSLTGTPISFPALVGVIALFGIVVKNSILIVDKINANVEIGLPFREAVADGASSRLEPIIFSSITNFIGLLPITISDPLWRGLGGAIISGLTMSGVIMLFFIPVVYYVWYEGEYTRS